MLEYHTSKKLKFNCNYVFNFGIDEVNGDVCERTFK